MKLLALGLLLSIGVTPVQIKAEEPVSIVEEISSSEVVEEGTSSQSEQVSTSIDENVDEDFDFGVWLQNYFTPEMITAIISILTALGAVLKVCSSLKELSKKHSMTSEEIYNKVLEALQEGIDGKTDEAIKNMIEPLQKNISEISPILQTFAKILALSQENTPQSRLAILELIQSLGKVDQSVIDGSKEEINNQVKQEQKAKDEEVEKLENISSKNKPVE